MEWLNGNGSCHTMEWLSDNGSCHTLEWLKWELPQYWEILGNKEYKLNWIKKEYGLLGKEKIQTMRLISLENIKNAAYWVNKEYKLLGQQRIQAIGSINNESCWVNKEYKLLGL